MAGLVPAIHVLGGKIKIVRKTWMLGIKPGMTG
jgi:hypothetical protein